MLSGKAPSCRGVFALLGIVFANSPAVGEAGAKVQEARAKAAAGASNSRDVERAKRKISAIAAEREDCRERAYRINDAAIQQCDSEAIDAFEALVPRSRGNQLLRELMPEMFDALVFTDTGGEDALRARKTVMATYFDLARLRAGILTGARQGTLEGRAPAGDSFDWVDRKTAGSLSRRWEPVKKADCADYPVQDCTSRLDAAFRQTVTKVAREGIGNLCPEFDPSESRGPGRLVCRGRRGFIVMPEL